MDNSEQLKKSATDQCAMRAMTPQELADAERMARMRVLDVVNYYLLYPTAANFTHADSALRDYQNAWMNGRERVVVLR